MVLNIWWTFIILSQIITGTPLRLVAYISSSGLHGEIRFESTNYNKVKIYLALKPTLQYPDQQWLWFITEFPVDYSILENRCENRYLGKKIIDLTELVGPLEFPGNETGIFEVSELRLTGKKGLWGKGILLKNIYNKHVICASVLVLGMNAEKVAEARFHGSVQGSIWFRSLRNQDNKHSTDGIIYSYLRYSPSSHLDDFLFQMTFFTSHRWKIYVTDVLNSGKERISCNILQTVFDPNNAGSGSSVGDIDERLGMLNISTRISESFRSFYYDSELALLLADLLGPHRILYLVIFHPTDENVFLACAKIKPRKSIIVKSLVNFRGIKGEVTLFQDTPFHLTWVNVSLSPVNNLETRLRYETKIASYRIHELPTEPHTVTQQAIEPCLATKIIYNPLKINIKEAPPAGFGTQDQYAIGDLSGKLQNRKEGSHHFDILPGSAKLSGLYWDTFLPLSGTYSINHRSLVIHKYNETDHKISSIPWICATFIMQLPKNVGPITMFTAEVIFRYPIVGKVIFRQPENEPEMDTTIIIENLIHADGSTLNTSYDHRWMIHNNPPGEDYYNWTDRCLSTGVPFNPYKINWNATYSSHCSDSDVSFCRIGDFSRHGTINIAGQKVDSFSLTRKLFTDSLITLSGSASIIGKSLVIYDDHGPKARGERLACSIITRVYKQKAIAKDWFGNGEKTTISGKLEFIQGSPYDVTDIEIDLEGLNTTMSGYHIHMTPVEINLEFPCESTSLYGHWNPLNVNTSITPPPGTGTTDQYEIGDLSGKFGTLDVRRRYTAMFNDIQLPLFGPWSILGRSIVIHKKKKSIRWACATIKRGYAPSEAKEFKAIASFHHPYGYAYGYIKMNQLIYNDGSQSDTIIEVNLRYPGNHDRNITRNHNWAIYVNPVGIDASVKSKDVRCVAAGYRWNPYLTQLSDPLNEDLYKKECGPDLPLRCDIGDISARLGPIDIGLERKLFIDSNFPLQGSNIALGKSIVILDKNFGNSKFACANIEWDYDIIKYANIRKPPRFVAVQFLYDVRRIMGIPEWMLSIDSRKTKTLHNGPIANKIEQDFNNLITTGKLDAPSLVFPGYEETKRKNIFGHRQCGNRDLYEKKSELNSSTYNVSMSLQILTILCGLVIILNFV